MGRRFQRLILAMLLCLAADPALAGQTARYLNRGNGSTMVIEAEGDNARLEVSGQNWHVLTTGGESYVVYDLPTGPRVLRMDDLRRIFEERRLAMPLPSVDRRWQLVARGQATIGGHRGLAYHLRIPEGVSPQPNLVISHAPALAALGAPLARQLDFSIMIVRLQGNPVPPLLARARALLGNGAALLFAGFALQRIETSGIDAARFAVPAEPLSLEEMRRNIEAGSPTL
jgi:hypothetical protein